MVMLVVFSNVYGGLSPAGLDEVLMMHEHYVLAEGVYAVDGNWPKRLYEDLAPLLKPSDRLWITQLRGDLYAMAPLSAEEWFSTRATDSASPTDLEVDPRLASLHLSFRTPP